MLKVEIQWDDATKQWVVEYRSAEGRYGIAPDPPAPTRATRLRAAIQEAHHFLMDQAPGDAKL